MMNQFSRREFIKMGAFLLPGLAYPRIAQSSGVKLDWLNDEMVGRVAISSVSVHTLPWDESTILYQRFRDEPVNLYEQVVSTYGPEYNPIWYRVWRGYVHSARVEIVKTRLNPAVSVLPENGQLGEITVPVTIPLRYDGKRFATKIYPLYYESTHWFTGIIEGPDNNPWYQITEAWSKEKYYVSADHVRLIPPEEMAPISPDVPAHKKRIEISIFHQTLTAFEDDKEVFKSKVSTGLNRAVPGEIPWRTPTGQFNIHSKMASKRMGDDPITSDVSGYVLPGVPWTCFFHETGVALHGTYWHNNFGSQMSHGCVNMRSEEAKWIFRWTTPVTPVDSRESRGLGTRIVVY
jgi:lipoprotein-anchoring transpeptidase ErfK/SrfK